MGEGNQDDNPQCQQGEARDLIDPDPDNPAAPNWANGEPAEVEVEWKLLQTEFANPANPKGVLEGAPEDLPGGDEVITRRYEFYKYTGPIDAETGEAMADTVGPDGLHGLGTVTYADHFDQATGEWVTVTVDTSTLVIVGDFFGAQMSGFDVAPALGLIDHIPDGELNVAYADRTVVVPGGNTPFRATTSGSLPDGTTLAEFTGVFSGTPTAAGVFTFTVDARDLITDAVLASKTYTVTIPAGVPVTSTIATSASPNAGGSTAGDGVYNNGTPVTVVATHNEGYAFVSWTENGAVVSDAAVYPFTVNGDRTLVANFVPGTPVLDISTATAVRDHGKVDVTVMISNSGGAAAQAVTIERKKDATIDGKATHEHAPITLGDIAPGSAATATLTVSGVKAGTRTIEVSLTYTGGTASLSVEVLIPDK